MISPGEFPASLVPYGASPRLLEIQLDISTAGETCVQCLLFSLEKMSDGWVTDWQWNGLAEPTNLNASKLKLLLKRPLSHPCLIIFIPNKDCYLKKNSKAKKFFMSVFVIN